MARWKCLSDSGVHFTRRLFSWFFLVTKFWALMVLWVDDDLCFYAAVHVHTTIEKNFL